MAIALVTSGGGSTSGSVATSASLNTTGADLLVVYVGSSNFSSGSAPVVTDSKGNAYTALPESLIGASSRGQLLYCDNPVVGTGHTVTATAVISAFPSIGVLAFSGANVAPMDQSSGAVNNSAVTTVQPGSITPSVAACVVVTGLTFNDSSTASISGSYTIQVTVAFSGGTTVPLALAYDIQTTATATNPTWTITNAGPMATRIASFKPATAGGGGGGASAHTFIG